MEVEIPSEKDFEYLNQAAKDFVKSKLSDLIQKWSMNWIQISTTSLID